MPWPFSASNKPWRPGRPCATVRAATRNSRCFAWRPDIRSQDAFDSGREVWVYRSTPYAPKRHNFTNIAPLLRAQTHSLKALSALFSPAGQALQWRPQDDSRDENTGLLNRGVPAPARAG